MFCGETTLDCEERRENCDEMLALSTLNTPEQILKTWIVA